MQALAVTCHSVSALCVPRLHQEIAHAADPRAGLGVATDQHRLAAPFEGQFEIAPLRIERHVADLPVEFGEF